LVNGSLIIGIMNLVSFLRSINLNVVIAAVVALIAFFQWRTNREKLRLDLYNRRFEIYLSYLNLYQVIMETKTVPGQETIDLFRRAVKESQFLFPTNSGLYDLLSLLETCALALLGERDYKPTDAQVEERKQMLEQVAPLISALERRMAPFLNFHDL
jgi:hypothetical protein